MTNRKVALVTGANKGIGQEIAHELVRRGLVVFVGSRDAKRGEEEEEESESNPV